MSSISKELKLPQKYTNHCIRATAVSLLDECNFEARHIMRVWDTNLRAAFALTPGVCRRLNGKKSFMLSLVPVLLKILTVK